MDALHALQVPRTGPFLAILGIEDESNCGQLGRLLMFAQLRLSSFGMHLVETV